MENLEKTIKKRYLIFMLTIVILIISVIVIINKNVKLQNADAQNINLFGKQRSLSERIIKEVLLISYNNDTISNSEAHNKLKELTTELEISQDYLYSKTIKEGNNKVVDSLFKVVGPYYNKILVLSRAILNNPEAEVIKDSLQGISDAGISYFETMDLIVNSYEKAASKKLQKLKKTIYFLAIIAFIILFGEFLFVLTPALKQLFKKNNALVKANKELAISENQIKANMLELTKLKTDLETKEAYNKIFIEQAPTAIAMLDNDMCYMAVSQRWISDYKMEGQEIIGHSHYDVFPEIGEDWKENHQKCLKGAIDACDEAPFVRADGSVQWIFWDVRPWYISEGNIGGLLMYTGDITHLKEKDLEKLRIEEILESTNSVARIGTWEVDLLKNKLFWSKTIRKIHEVPDDFEPNLETAINFYKKGESRNKIQKAVSEAMEFGTAYDLELEIVTAKNNVCWVRAIGQVEFVEGNCVRLFGVFQDINKVKKAQNELLKKNQLLNFAEEITMMGHWQWDTVTDKVQWSNNLYKLFELDEATIDLKFDSYFNFVHPEDKDIVTDYFDKATKEKSFYNFTHRIITTKGKIKTVQLLGEVITDDNDEVIEMIGTGQDITQQKMAENKFRGLLESAPDATVIVNEKGKIQLINKQAENLFGYHADELFGKSVEILIPERFIGTHTAHRDGFFTHPKTRRMGQGKELFGINKKGTEIPIQISLSPLQTEEGLLVSAAIRDITIQKQAERKIIKARNDLEILAQKLTLQNNQLADFAHITSHNLRAPVSNLNSLLGLYNISESEEDKIVLFEKFEKVIHHLTLTLNTLVEAVKMKDLPSGNLEEITFDEVLNNTKEILSGEILKTGAIITNNFSKTNKISYNKVYLESIFLNLVGNAIKYRSEDRIPELFIESEIEDGKIKLKFKDNGMGIDLERHGQKLFGLNKVFHRHPDAKGVGLFMTKAQIEAMGGVISATSIVNEGTTFNINFN